MSVQLHTGLRELQQKAVGLLENFHTPAQRYGTAFHLTPPFGDVRGITPEPMVPHSARLRGAQQGRGGGVRFQLQPPLSPLSGGNQSGDITLKFRL